MKRYLILSIAFLLFTTTGFTQNEDPKEKYPNSFLDIGLGVGSNYGILGVKSVIGYRGTGVLVGIGRIDELSTFDIGFQVTYLSWFASLSYATTGTYHVEYFNQTDKGLIKEMVFLTGTRLSINKPKTLFVELGIGISTGGEVPLPYGPDDQISGGVKFCLGLGYRIGKLN